MNHNQHTDNVLNQIKLVVENRSTDIETLIQASGGWEKWFQGELICQLRRNYNALNHNTNSIYRNVYSEFRYPSNNWYCDAVITETLHGGKENPILWIELKCMGLNSGLANNKKDWTPASIDAWCQDVVVDRKKIQTLNDGAIALLMVPNIGAISDRAISNIESDGWANLGRQDGLTLLMFNKLPNPIVID